LITEEFQWKSYFFLKNGTSNFCVHNFQQTLSMKAGIYQKTKFLSVYRHYYTSGSDAIILFYCLFFSHCILFKFEIDCQIIC